MTGKFKSSETLIPVITIFSDIIAVFVSFLFSYWIRFYSPVTHYLPIEKGIGIAPIHWYLILALIVTPFWIIIFQSRKMYRPRRVVFIFDEFFVITRLVTFGVIFSLGLIFFYREFPYSRIVFLLIWLFAIFFITIGRYLVLKVEKTLYSKGKALKKTIVIGSNESAAEIYRNFINHRYAGYEILGYLKNDDEPVLDNEQKYHLLGNYSQINDIISNYDVETCLVTLPSNQNEILFNIMKSCEGVNVEFLLSPDFLEMITSSVRVQEIDSIPFLKIKSIPMSLLSRIVKRSFDLFFSFSILFITSPLLILIAVIIKLSSKGPVFYKQERISLEGNKFDMIKFRSMIINAEDKTGVVMAMKEDDRITSIGKILRKFSLDELPQFINVLKGEMSIVGPRPEREYFINIMKEKIPRYLDRHRVKCGITGWAQVNGLRGQDTSLEKRIEFDIYYVENWSVVFDVKIIIKTIKEMFFSKAAF